MAERPSSHFKSSFRSSSSIILVPLVCRQLAIWTNIPIEGCVTPLSHRDMKEISMPDRYENSSWVNPNSSRRRLSCSPKALAVLFSFMLRGMDVIVQVFVRAVQGIYALYEFACQSSRACRAAVLIEDGRSHARTCRQFEMGLESGAFQCIRHSRSLLIEPTAVALTWAEYTGGPKLRVGAAP
jgi:hypothetical protein